jgi:hypothetical protein
METLRNALGFFEENGQIIVKKDRSGRQEAAMTLHPDWIPKYSRSDYPTNRSRLSDGTISEDGKLLCLVEKISISRREGKNRFKPGYSKSDVRRDNPTVSRRVLELADRLGQPLGKQTASLEAVLKGGAGDVFTTKSVKLGRKNRGKPKL